MLNSVPERQNIQKQEIEPMVNCLKMIGEKDHQCMMGMGIVRTSICSHFYQKPNFCYLCKSCKRSSTTINSKGNFVRPSLFGDFADENEINNMLHVKKQLIIIIWPTTILWIFFHWTILTRAPIIQKICYPSTSSHITFGSWCGDWP